MHHPSVNEACDHDEFQEDASRIHYIYLEQVSARGHFRRRPSRASLSVSVYIPPLDSLSPSLLRIYLARRVNDALTNACARAARPCVSGEPTWSLFAADAESLAYIDASLSLCVYMHEAFHGAAFLFRPSTIHFARSLLFASSVK